MRFSFCCSPAVPLGVRGRGPSGFTLVELLVMLALLGVLLGVAVPHINSMLDESNYMECGSRLELLRRAKTAYVIDHVGAGSPATAADKAVFRVYFQEHFRESDFSCPRSTNAVYLSPYDVYAISTCPYCATNRPEGARNLDPVVP